MTISVKMIADSQSAAGKRITTMQLRYPRFIHAEFMTHRALSKNASSSRAIPVAKLIQDIRDEPAMPVYWGSNKPGMQAGDEIENKGQAMVHWLEGMEQSIKQVEALVGLGLHKQIANRMLEPWAHINVVCTGTEFANFFNLRCHPEAQPEMHQLADTMKYAMDMSIPNYLAEGKWHLPYVNWEEGFRQAWAYAKRGRITRDEPGGDEILKLLRKVSTARCARVSYLTHDGRKTSVEEDIELHDRLVVAVPLHASPAEHQATPDEGIQSGFNIQWLHPADHGNLVGWRQYRKMLPGEFVAG